MTWPPLWTGAKEMTFAGCSNAVFMSVFLFFFSPYFLPISRTLNTPFLDSHRQEEEVLQVAPQETHRSTAREPCNRRLRPKNLTPSTTLTVTAGCISKASLTHRPAVQASEFRDTKKNKIKQRKSQVRFSIKHQLLGQRVSEPPKWPGNDRRWKQIMF